MNEQKDGGPTPLTPEAVAQMVADREAGTPGPWHADGPVWNQIIWTDSENRLCFMAHSNGLNDDRDIANARRIARLPDLEAAYLTLAAENATLRAELAQVREAITVKGGTEHAPTEWAYLKACETIRGRDVTIATLRASEAAAMERNAEMRGCINYAELELDNIDANLRQFLGQKPQQLMHPTAAEYLLKLVREVSARLTPTADKEPTT